MTTVSYFNQKRSVAFLLGVRENNLIMNVGEVDLSSLRVLAVDDDADCLELLIVVLQAYGIEVVTAPSALEALAVMARFTPDLLILDIAMPEMDGYTLLRQIRTLAVKPDEKIPAIALTAFATDNERAAAIRAGFQIYLIKPLDFAELITAIEQLADGIK